MKLVREHINEKFTEDSDPVKDMGIGKKAMFNALEKRGVSMWFGWGEWTDGSKHEGEEERLKTLDDIEYITSIVNKLEKVGFDVKQMRISRHNSIGVNTITVLRSQHVIADCASEEDADIVIDTMKKFTIWEHDIFRKSNGEKIISIYPGHLKWLDELIENRQKYKSFV